MKTTIPYKKGISEKYLPVLLIFFISSSFLFAQGKKIDSLRNALLSEKEDTNKANTLGRLSKIFENSDQDDSALIYAAEEKKLAEKLGFKRAEFRADNSMGRIYLNRADYSKALEYMTEGLAVAREIGNKSDIAMNLANIGLIYDDKDEYAKALEYNLEALAMDQEVGDKQDIAMDFATIGSIYNDEGNFVKSIEFHLKSLSLNQEVGNKHGMSNNLLDIGIVHSEQGDYPKALEYMQKALDIDEQSGNKKGISIEVDDIGVVYKHMGNYEKALEYLNKGLVIKKELGNKYGLATILGNIGNVYALQKDYTKALEYLFKALSLSKEIGDRHGIVDNLGNIGIIYVKQKNFRQAKICLDSVLRIAKSIKNKQSIIDVYEGLALLDSATSNYKTGLEDYKNYIIYRDSLVNEANTKKTVQAEMNFEFEQQQTKEKAEQDKKDVVAEQERTKQKIIRNSFIGGFALMLALAFFIFRGYRQKQRDNIIITQQKEEVEKQKTLVEHQKALVEEKNKDILDSITYAKRLQDAILPPMSIIKQYLPESFVLYKPKDIVAGDFYWLSRSPLPVGEGKGEVTLIAAADCTGHGVPGALVSVVCSNALNRTVKEFKITEPGKILDKVRELVLETFEKSEDNVQDGMDISLCAISSLSTGEGPGVRLSWSGAYNSLWYITDGEMKEIPADKQPIGKTDNPKPFTTHTITLPNGEGKGGAFYLFTDGFADQFGGPKGKKFKYKQLQEKLLAISHQPLAKQKNVLEQTFEEWKGDLEQVDDVLVIGIKV